MPIASSSHPNSTATGLASTDCGPSVSAADRARFVRFARGFGFEISEVTPFVLIFRTHCSDVASRLWPSWETYFHSPAAGDFELSLCPINNPEPDEAALEILGCYRSHGAQERLQTHRLHDLCVQVHDLSSFLERVAGDGCLTLPSHYVSAVSDSVLITDWTDASPSRLQIGDAGVVLLSDEERTKRYTLMLNVPKEAVPALIGSAAQPSLLDPRLSFHFTTLTRGLLYLSMSDLDDCVAFICNAHRAYQAQRTQGLADFLNGVEALFSGRSMA